jgi:hypothetical protein
MEQLEKACALVEKMLREAGPYASVIMRTDGMVQINSLGQGRIMVRASLYEAVIHLLSDVRPKG